METLRLLIEIPSVTSLNLQNERCKYKVITDRVNKTALYDELIVGLLNSIGIEILDIHALHSVESKFAMVPIPEQRFRSLMLGLKIVSVSKFNPDQKYIEKGDDTYG
jgi:hypothetical protein